MKASRLRLRIDDAVPVRIDPASRTAMDGVRESHRRAPFALYSPMIGEYTAKVKGWDCRSLIRASNSLNVIVRAILPQRIRHPAWRVPEDFLHGPLPDAGAVLLLHPEAGIEVVVPQQLQH